MAQSTEVEYVPGVLCSYSSILAITVPSVLLNAAAPAVATIQTSLLGHLQHDTQEQVAAFAAASVCSNFVILLCNFLVDGVSAKIGYATGKQAWARVKQLVIVAMWAALAAGATAAAAFMALHGLVNGAMALPGPVRAHLRPYWRLRCAYIPLQLWVMAMNGVLAGFNRVSLNALVLTLHAALEVGLSCLALRGGFVLDALSGLRGLGAASIAAYLLTATVLSLLVLLLRPAEAPKSFSLLSRDDPEHDSAEPLLLTASDSTPCPEQTAAFTSTQMGNASTSAHACEALPLSPESVVTEHSGSRIDAPSPGLPGAAGPHGDDALALAEEGALGPATASAPDGSTSDAVALGTSHRARRCVQAQDLFAFVGDGVNVLTRSATLQGTFVVAMVCAARLGPATMAAHQIVAQLWMLTSYIVDGFACAGTVLGSRLSAWKSTQQGARDLQVLCWRLSGMGTATGAAIGAVLLCERRFFVDFFTRDPAIVTVLEGGALWSLIAAVQPVNAAVFMYDGFLYAGQFFAFMRNQMLLGAAILFLPALGLALVTDAGLTGIWAAKATLNLWRLASAMAVVLSRFVQ